MRLRDGYSEPDETGLLPTKTFRDEAALALFVQLLHLHPADRPAVTAAAKMAYERADALLAAR